MKFKITAKKTRIIILICIIILLIYTLYLVRAILTPFIIAILLSYLLNPIVDYLENYRIKRTYAILFTYLSIIVIISLFALYFFPIFLREINKLAEAIPEYTAQIQSMVRHFYRDFQRIEIPESIRQVTNENIDNLEQLLLDSLDGIASKIWGVFSSLFSIIIAPILAFYILKDIDRLSERLLSIFPTSARDELINLWIEIDGILTKFIRGHLLVASIVGILTTIGLAIIGMKFSILLGIIAGLADLIPYFGPILGTVPAVALALLNSEIQVFYVILVMFVVQQIESNLLSPRILGESVGLHPLMVVFVLLAGGHLFGIIGLLFSVPVAAVGRIVMNYMFNKIIS